MDFLVHLYVHISMCVCAFCVCAFSLVFPSHLCLLVLFAIFFSNVKEVMELDGEVGRETVIRTYYMKKIFFSVLRVFVS